MRSHTLLPYITAVCAITAGLAGCGAGQKAGSKPPSSPIVIDPSIKGTRGELLGTPTRVHSWDAQGLYTAMANFGPTGTYLAGISGRLICGVDVYQFSYGTVGAAGEATTASGALMVPTGDAQACLGSRSVVLYGHGNTQRRDANMADVRPDTPLGSAALTAIAMYASQGDVVVAPNYVGYHTSALGYHPHHIADQQSKDMIDALTAARKALPTVAPSSQQNGKLFITGFSEGGYAAMATHRAMQAAGMPVTASSPQGGAFAESVGFEKMMGAPNGLDNLDQVTPEQLLLYIMKFVGWQKAYGNIYSTPADLFPAAYAAGLESLLPSTLPASQIRAKLPPYLLANDMPHYSRLTAAQQAYFGPPEQSLLKTSVIMAIQADIVAHPCPSTSASAPLACSPSHPARKAWLNNDMRDWVPTSPVLMCGGNADPVVGFPQAQLALAYFEAHKVRPGLVTLLDVDSPASANDPHALAKETFASFRLRYLRAGTDIMTGPIYHGSLAFMGCAVAGREFFKRF